MDFEKAGEKRLLELNEMKEFRTQAYENVKFYMERTARWHDKKITLQILLPGQRVLLFNLRLRLFLGKLRTRWSGPFVIVKVSPHGAVELQTNDGITFKVNGQHLKHYIGVEERWIENLAFIEWSIGSV